MEQQLHDTERKIIFSRQQLANRVLVVEDDKNLTVLIGYALLEVNSDIEVDWASSLESAMTHFVASSINHKQAPYDLLIVDIFLEGTGNGFDLIKIIHRMYPQISFLIVTSLSYSDVKESLPELQTANIIYLKKPFLYSSCKTEIRQIFNIQKYIKGGSYEQ